MAVLLECLDDYATLPWPTHNINRVRGLSERISRIRRAYMRKGGVVSRHGNAMRRARSSSFA